MNNKQKPKTINIKNLERLAMERKLKAMTLSKKAQGAAVAAAYAKGQKTQSPNISTSKISTGLTTRIRHRELIYSVIGSSTFTVQTTFALNPGIAATFPWLSTQAASWEQYRFNTLRFCYYTRCATSVPGSVMLVPDYDAADAAPVTEQIASSYRDTVEEVPWIEEFCCELDPMAMCDGFKMNRKFTRIGTVSGTDIKTYDVGNLFLCTTDGTNVNWGKLWVEYDVELYVPQLPASGQTFISGLITGVGSISKTNYLGNTPTVVGNLGVILTGMTFAFQQVGQYLVTAYIQGTGVYAGGAPVWTSTGYQFSQDADTANNADTGIIIVMRITVTVPGQLITIVDNGSTSVTACSIAVSSYTYSNGGL